MSLWDLYVALLVYWTTYSYVDAIRTQKRQAGVYILEEILKEQMPIV